jgi:predicted Zn-dependent protease
MIKVLRRLGAFVLVTLVLGAGSGCTVNPATGHNEFTVVGPEHEAAMGRAEHPKVLEAFGGVYEEDVELNAYVAAVGARLRAVSELEDQPFTFTVLDSPVVNAFALPGGYVYVTRGLVALAANEAELAGVLAHEIGHVTARHTAQRVTTGLFASLGAAVLGAATGNQVVADLAQVGAAAYVQGFSRDQELEADTLGVRYLVRAGYDPRAMASFLRSLELHGSFEAELAGREGREPEADLFSSHPRTVQRIALATDAAIAETGGVSDPFVGRDEYLDRVAGMLYGDSPEEGYVRGRSFAHPLLGFRFDAPPGFRLANGPDAVIAVSRDGSAFQFDGVKVKAARPMVDYLVSGWLDGVDLTEVEAIQVNGMAAATGTARGRTRAGPVDARAVAIRFDGRQVYRFLFVAPPARTAALNEEFRRTTHSFRPLTEAEKAALRPQRLRLARVRAGDTAETFAKLMAPDDLPLERFRALNGLAPGQPLEVGSRVKIVVE